MAAAYKDNRCHRRHFVEVASQRQPLFLQLSFVPIAVGDDNFARFGALDAIAHGLEHFVDGTSAREIDTRSAAGVVQVVVGKPGDYGQPAQIDELSVRACERADRVVGTDSSELVASDRDGLRVGELGVDGYDLGVVVDDVGSRSATSDLPRR